MVEILGRKSRGRREYTQEAQFRQLAQSVWNGTRKTVQVEIQAHQVRQISKVTGNWSTDIITVKFPVINQLIRLMQIRSLKISHTIPNKFT